MSQETVQKMKKPQGPEEETINPIFDEIEGISPENAINILIQAAGQAQGAGALTVRDSVLLAKAIAILRPGSI